MTSCSVLYTAHCAQRAAPGDTSPAPQGKRKVVLATNIAETSLTIEGIRLVVDSAQERVARFDVRSGLTRLITQRVSQASMTQRAGRAGRLEPGVCVHLLAKDQASVRRRRAKRKFCKAISPRCCSNFCNGVVTTRRS